MESESNTARITYSPHHPVSMLSFSPEHSNAEATTSTRNFRKITEKAKTLIGNTAENVRSSLSNTYEAIKHKVENVKRKEKKVDSGSGSKIFVTKSSIEFTQIKSDDKFIDYHPKAYPIIGACVVAFPYAFKQAGFPLGLILLIAIAIMVEYSEVLLIQCSVLADEVCLQIISKNLFGRTGFAVAYVIPYLYSSSVLLSYNVILADTCTKFINAFLRMTSSTATIHRRITLLMMTLIIIPISMTTNVKRIFKWSLISLVSASFVTVLVSVRLFTLSEEVPHTYNTFKFLNINLLQSVAVMTFALSCQHTCRLYYATIDQNKDFRSNKPASIASSYSLLCTVVLGVCGYLTFKGVTQSDILENYCEEDVFAAIARMFFAGFILCLYPLECQAIRHLLQQIVVVHKTFQNIFNFIITIIMLAPAFILALFIDCLALVLELAGLLLAIPLVFILPAIYFVHLSPGTLYSTKKLPCLVSVAAGLTISVCGLTMTIFSGHYCIHQSTMFPYCNGSSELLGPLITLMSLNGTSNFDSQSIGLNLTSFQLEFDNITDIVTAYLT